MPANRLIRRVHARTRDVPLPSARRLFYRQCRQTRSIDTPRIIASDVTSAPPAGQTRPTRQPLPLKIVSDSTQRHPRCSYFLSVLRRLTDNAAFVAALGIGFVYAATMSGHLTSIDGYLMWQQANALVFHHSLLFQPPINWETHVFNTSYFAIGLSLAYVPGLFLWSLLRPDAAAHIAPQVGPAGMYQDVLYPRFGAPIHILATAASAYLVARIIRQLGLSERTALLGLGLYALSSLAFVYARGDYAQPLETFCWLVAFSAAISLRTRRSWPAMLCVGAAVCLAVLTRTLEGMLLVPALILVLAPDFRSLRRLVVTPQTAAVLAGLVVGLGATALVNELRYGNVLETGYGTAGRPGAWSGPWNTPLLVGSGSLISPARGIIWATPAI